MLVSLVSAHCFKNELCFLCSVLVFTHRFKNDLCYMCTVLFSTHGLNWRVLLHVRLASLDLGLKERVMLHVQCACFDSWHDWTSCDSIGIDVFPMDPMDSIGRLSNPPQSIVYTSGNSSGLYCTSGFIFRPRLRRTPGFVHWNLVERNGHVCSLMGMYHWTESHFHDWIDYYGAAF